MPNVVYSCGALVHGGHLILRYGIGDARIGFARVVLTDLMAALAPLTPSPSTGRGAGFTGPSQRLDRPPR